MHRQRGLTAVELVIVVAVIAMLAAMAVPRFTSLDRQARAESVVTLADGVKSTAELAHRIWAAAGEPQTLSFQGEILDLVHGYPTERSIAKAVVGPGSFRYAKGVWIHGDARSALDCGVVYLPPPAEGARATINAYTDGC